MAGTARILCCFTIMVVMLSLLLPVHQEVVLATSGNTTSKRLFGIKTECLRLKLNPLSRSCCHSYQIDPCNPSSSCGAQTLLEQQKHLECCASNNIESALNCF